MLGPKLAADLYDLSFVGDRDDEDEVLVDVRHDEPAAIIGPRSDGNPSHSLYSAPYEEETTQVSETIYILAYKRRGRELFCEALAQSVGLQECSSALKSAGLDCEPQDRGYIFVSPHLYKEVCRTLKVIEHELRPYTICISQQYKQCLDEVLAQMPYRKRPKECANRQLTLEVEVPVAAAASSEAGESVALEVHSSLPDGLKILRTFICTVPLLADGTSVIQSTTEAVTDASEFHFAYRRGLNPRRCSPAD